MKLSSVLLINTTVAVLRNADFFLVLRRLEFPVMFLGLEQKHGIGD